MSLHDLRATMFAAFPPEPISRATIFADDASWTDYEERAALELLVGKRWIELEPSVLEQHETLLVHAGTELFVAVLPAYLVLLAEHAFQTALPFVVAGQLVLAQHGERFAAMTDAQRTAVRDACGWLARMMPMRPSSSAAPATW